VPCRSPRSAARSSSVRELGPSPVWHGPVPSAPNTPKPTVGLTGPSHLVGGVSSWQRSPCSCCDRASWAILTRQIVSRGIVLGALLGIVFVLCTIGMQTTSVLISAFVTGTTVVFAPLITWILLRRRLTTRAAAAVFLQICGNAASVRRCRPRADDRAAYCYSP
jgi:hypothetical protein